MSQTGTDERLAEGTVIEGRYSVKHLLGTGGFANVYLAEHLMLGTDVAVKVLHAPLATSSDSSFAARFEREARVAAQMRHPNVVNVTDFGFLDGGDPFIVMEYLEGRDLDQELREVGTLEPDRLLRLMVPAIQAVGEAHEMGVVHKDLKPSNLFIVDAGKPTERLLVLDFGVARVFNDADENITQTGAFTGTPAYLPPEYIREQRVTAAFDVYQVGLILIECMTGRRAVEADGPMGFLLAHCMGRLSVAPEFFDNDLGRVIQKAIAIEDGDRYPNCEALAEALKEVQPPAAESFVAADYVREASPMSSQDVAAFADTMSSGELIGDAFITGTSSQGELEGAAAAALTQAQRAQANASATTGLPVHHEPRSRKTLLIVAAFLLCAVVAAGVGAAMLLQGAGADNGVAAAGTDAGLAGLPGEEPAGLADAGVPGVASGLEAATAEAVRTAEEVAASAETASGEGASAAARKDEANAEAAEAAEAEAEAERLRERRSRERAERERKAAEERAKKEAEENAQERLLLVD